MYILIGVIVLILIVIVTYCGLVVRNITLSTHQSNQESIKAVVVSDLHNARYGVNQRILMNKIKSCQPDLILIPGDMVEDQHNLLPTEQFFQQITKIAPCYYCTGNHEARSVNMNIHQIKQWLKDKGVIVLDYKSELINIKGMKLLISGVDDPRIYPKQQQDQLEQQAMKQAFFSEGGKQAYRILLAHRPERAEYYQKFGFDCIVSGHAHGGQVRLPGLINGLYAPNQGLFPKYAGGKYQLENSTLVVSRGLCKRVWLPRVFNPPEIVKLTILG